MTEISHQRHFNRYPMLLTAGYFAVGIAVARVSYATVLLSAGTLAFLLIAAGLRRSLAGILLPIIFIPLGMICYQIGDLPLPDSRIRQIYSGGLIASYDPVEISGTVLGSPELTPTGSIFRLRVERLVHRGMELRVSGVVRLFANIDGPELESEYAQLDLSYGSRILISCNLEREARYLNPGVSSRLDIFDEQGIDAVASIKSPLLIERLGHEPVFPPLAWVYEQRRDLIDFFKSRFTEQTSGVLIASLLGDKYFLDRETAEVFRDGGTFHVLVISGLHITFIGMLSLWLVSLFTRRVRIQSVVTAVFLWSYTLAVGAEIPVVRASVMFSIILFSRASYLSSSPLNGLGTCGLLLLAIRPSDLFSASFQLTFVSVAAIVACAFPMIQKLRSIGNWTPSADTPFPADVSNSLRRFCELLYWNEAAWQIEVKRQIWSANLFKAPLLNLRNATPFKTLMAYIFEGALVSLVVQLWLLPLLIIHFHRVSPASLFLNLWVGFFLALESFAALAAVMLSTISDWLAAPLILATELLNLCMTSVPGWFSEGAVAGIRVPIYPGAGRVFYWLFAVGILASGLVLFRWDPFALVASSRPKTYILHALFAITLILGGIIVLHPFSAPAPNGRLSADFLDVGQGDSALVTFPEGRTMVIDGGGKSGTRDDEHEGFEPDIPRVGEFVVSEFLWEKGYSRVDYLLATHADSDHLEGLIDVARNFDIGALVLSRRAIDDPGYFELIAVATRKKIPVMFVSRGDEMAIGGALLQFLHPEATPATSGKSDNNDSIVLRIQIGSRSFLFTGDIERESEKLMDGSELMLKADVVKVPHHGSRTSSTPEFIAKVNPTIAVIPVGRRSRFGHPHKEVVGAWRRSGASVVTTGAEGAVTVSTDGNDLTVHTFSPPK